MESLRLPQEPEATLAELARFVDDPHDIPESADCLGKVIDEMSPTEASMIYVDKSNPTDQGVRYYKIPCAP